MPKKIQQPVAKAPKGDPQRERLYRMEREALGGWGMGRITLEEARAFMRRCARLYGLKPCRVRDKDLGVWAGWYQGRKIIRSSTKPGGRGLLVLLHEAAHYIHDELAPGNEHESHGAQFVCCYLHLMDRARAMPVEAGKAMCDRYRIRYIDPGDCMSIGGLERRLR